MISISLRLALCNLLCLWRRVRGLRRMPRGSCFFAKTQVTFKLVTTWLGQWFREWSDSNSAKIWSDSLRWQVRIFSSIDLGKEKIWVITLKLYERNSTTALSKTSWQTNCSPLLKKYMMRNVWRNSTSLWRMILLGSGFTRPRSSLPNTRKFTIRSLTNTSLMSKLVHRLLIPSISSMTRSIRTIALWWLTKLWRKCTTSTSNTMQTYYTIAFWY